MLDLLFGRGWKEQENKRDDHNRGGKRDRGSKGGVEQGYGAQIWIWQRDEPGKREAEEERG